MRRCIPWGHEVEFARDPKGISGEQQHSGNTVMEVILSPAQVVPLLKPPRGGLVPRGRLQERMSKFASGEWELFFVCHWKVRCRASMQVAGVAEDSETLLPAPAQLGWRI